MNETPAATPRVHAGCGHLCLTCGAQAAVRAVTSDVVINVCIIVSLAVATLLASVLISHVIEMAAQEYTARQKPVPPPMAGQSLSYAGETTTPQLRYVNTIAHTRSAFDLVTDSSGRVEFGVPQDMMCIASAGDAGSLYSVTAGRTRVFWGARPNSIIHVVCW